MILSYICKPKDQDSSSDSVKAEEFNEIENIMNTHKQKIIEKDKEDLQKEQSNAEWEDAVSLSNSSQISKIDIRSQSIGSSMKESLSRAEECIQKDIWCELDEDSLRKRQTHELINSGVFGKPEHSMSEDKILDISNDVSFNSQKNKNYILKPKFNASNEGRVLQIPGQKKGSGQNFSGCFNYFVNSQNEIEAKYNSWNVSNGKERCENQSPIPKQLSHQQTKSVQYGAQFLPNQDNMNEWSSQIEVMSIRSNSGSNMNNILNAKGKNNSGLSAPQSKKADKHSSSSFQNQQNLMSTIQPMNAIPLSTAPNKNNINIMSSMGNKPIMNNMSNIQNMAPMPSMNLGQDHAQTTEWFKQKYNDNMMNFEAYQAKDMSSIAQKDMNLLMNCCTLCKEQTGCRIWQKAIDDCPSITSEIIYPKILDQILDLSCDQFGNYFVQKVIEHLSSTELEDWLKRKIQNQFRSWAFNQHGTRVLQKFFERIINNEYLLNWYTLLLTPNMRDFLIDPNACHIIIKYISLVPSPGNNFVIEFLGQNILEFATKKHSCSALQKCIEFANPTQRYFLLMSVANNSYNLFTDQYGNYVVQFAINAYDFKINHLIVINFLRDFPKFSSQKYSSNVIEKCLDCCDDNTKMWIIEKLCEESLITTLLFDMYGNYVWQKTMMLAQEPYRSRYWEWVGRNMEKLQWLSFGPKWYNKLLTTFPELVRYVRVNGINNMNFNSKKKANKKMGNANTNAINPNAGVNYNNNPNNNNIQMSAFAPLMQGQSMNQRIIMNNMNNLPNMANASNSINNMNNINTGFNNRNNDINVNMSTGFNNYSNVIYPNNSATPMTTGSTSYTNYPNTNPYMHQFNQNKSGFNTSSGQNMQFPQKFNSGQSSSSNSSKNNTNTNIFNSQMMNQGQFDQFFSNSSGWGNSSSNSESANKANSIGNRNKFIGQFY